MPQSNGAGTADQQSSGAAAGLAGNIAAAAIAGVAQPSLFNAVDCLRIRWQASTERTTGVLQFARRVVLREGLWRGLWRPGLVANVLAVSTSQGARMGFYPVARDALAPGDGPKAPAAMAAAGLLCGSAAYLATAPLWLLKTRAQAAAELDGRAPLLLRRDLVPRRLWKGASALVVRGGCITCGQMLGYDFCKSRLKHRGVADGPLLHLVASTSAALAATILAAPADALQTRYQASRTSGSVWDCARDMARRGGPAVFFRGCAAQYARLVGTFALGTTIYEQARAALGLGFLD